MAQTIVSKDEEKIRNLPIWDEKDPSKKFSEKEEEYLRDMINCEFMNLKEPGMSHKFVYGNTNNKHVFEFFHGGTYRIPRFIKMHLESKGGPIWKYRPNGEGGMVKQIVGHDTRFLMKEVM